MAGMWLAVMGGATLSVSAELVGGERQGANGEQWREVL